MNQSKQKKVNGLKYKLDKSGYSEFYFRLLFHKLVPVVPIS